MKLDSEIDRCSGVDVRDSNPCPERETCERWLQRDTGQIAASMLCFGDNKGYYYKIRVNRES